MLKAAARRIGTSLKLNQRFDYARLAEILQAKGMVDPNALRELLALAQSQGGGFTEALVSSGYVSDWDLSRVVCEIFQLPFLPVGVFEPDIKAADGLDKQFLLQHALVPVARFGQVLTVSMPALVPAEVLGMLAAENDLVVLPVVGTVQTNRNWVEANLVQVDAPGKGGAWGELFDEADAAVMGALQKVHTKDGDLEAEAAALEFAIAPDSEEVGEVALADPALGDFDLGLDASSDLEEIGAEDLGLNPVAEAAPAQVPGKTTPSLSLPPAPKF